MKKIIVVPVPKRKGVYLCTITESGHVQAAFGSVPEPYPAEDLPKALIRLGVDESSANRAADEAEKNGSWIGDITE